MSRSAVPVRERLIEALGKKLMPDKRGGQYLKPENIEVIDGHGTWR